MSVIIEMEIYECHNYLFAATPDLNTEMRCAGNLRAGRAGEAGRGAPDRLRGASFSRVGAVFFNWLSPAVIFVGRPKPGSFLDELNDLFVSINYVW